MKFGLGQIQVDSILENSSLRKGLEKYQYILSKLHHTNVAEDIDFQKKYNGFYKLRQRPKSFYRDYYAFMERMKNKDVTFEETLEYMNESQGEYLISFCSKLVPVINPEYPTWDKIVTKDHFGISAPYAKAKKREQRIIERYNEYCRMYNEYIGTDEAKMMIQEFDKYYPDAEITDVKKIDFILWQNRDEKNIVHEEEIHNYVVPDNFMNPPVEASL